MCRAAFAAGGGHPRWRRGHPGPLALAFLALAWTGQQTGPLWDALGGLWPWSWGPGLRPGRPGIGACPSCPRGAGCPCLPWVSFPGGGARLASPPRWLRLLSGRLPLCGGLLRWVSRGALAWPLQGPRGRWGFGLLGGSLGFFRGAGVCRRRPGSPAGAPSVLRRASPLLGAPLRGSGVPSAGLGRRPWDPVAPLASALLVPLCASLRSFCPSALSPVSSFSAVVWCPCCPASLSSVCPLSPSPVGALCCVRARPQVQA